MNPIDDPESLRLRAAEMRSRANLALLADTKQGLLRIAGDFDVLAERAEERLAAYARLHPADSPGLGADEPFLEVNHT